MDGARKRSFPVFLFLLQAVFLYGFACPFSASGGSDGGDRSPARWGGIGDLEALSGLPESQVSLERALLLASSVGESDLYGISVDPAGVGEKIGGLAARFLPRAGAGDPRTLVSALNRFLFVEERYAYDANAGDPENYLPNRVLSRKRGNCLGLTMLYLAIAERAGIPLRGSYVPGHSFVRYEGEGRRINIETAERGAERTDERYSQDFRLSDGRPYLRTLGKKEMIGVYLKSLGAAYARKGGMEEKAVRIYRAAIAFYPDLPDAHYNLGISYQQMDRQQEAIAEYRRAIELDGDLDVARDNLAVALARSGRFMEALEEARKAVTLAPTNVIARRNLAATLCACGMLEDGIREFRNVLEARPDDPRALAGLAKAYYSRGKYREAAAYSDRAMQAGFRFDPAMLGVLDKYRDPIPVSPP